MKVWGQVDSLIPYPFIRKIPSLWNYFRMLGSSGADPYDKSIHLLSPSDSLILLNTNNFAILYCKLVFYWKCYFIDPSIPNPFAQSTWLIYKYIFWFWTILDSKSAAVFYHILSTKFEVLKRNRLDELIIEFEKLYPAELCCQQSKYAFLKSLWTRYQRTVLLHVREASSSHLCFTASCYLYDVILLIF